MMARISMSMWVTWIFQSPSPSMPGSIPSPLRTLPLLSPRMMGSRAAMMCRFIPTESWSGLSPAQLALPSTTPTCLLLQPGHGSTSLWPMMVTLLPDKGSPFMSTECRCRHRPRAATRAEPLSITQSQPPLGYGVEAPLPSTAASTRSRPSIESWEQPKYSTSSTPVAQESVSLARRHRQT